METMENKRNLLEILCIVFLIGAIVLGIVCVVQMAGRERAQEQLESLAQDTVKTEEAGDRTSEDLTDESADRTPDEPETEEPEDSIERLKSMGIPIPDKEVDFAELQESVNEDIYAWIYIPDSKIDYPILQHPTDNLYYLNHNLDGSKGYPGCIYSENYNARDFSDPNTVLYGHNMKKGTMFAGLHLFEDSEYFEAHPYVYIYTPEELLVYEIFAAYEYSNEHLLYNYDFTNRVIYQDYLDEIYELRSMNHIVREDRKVTADDHIITLSTCIANKPDNRYLVQGVLLNED